MLFAKTIEKNYRARLYSRADENSAVFYFSAADFSGLCAEPFSFPSKTKPQHTLRGYFYRYDSSVCPAPISDRIVVFDHGMGGGHRAYMREIEMLARRGYVVFSYDHTGCMESEGESAGGFAQSLSDLDACLTALKKCERAEGSKISIMGHSWGGFSAMNIAALHPGITHVVAMSGFISVDMIVRQNFGGLMSLYRGMIRDIEEEANPYYSRFNAIDTLRQTSAKTLIIHSADDKTVRVDMHFEPLRLAVEIDDGCDCGCCGNDNVTFLLVDGKGHNPNYTSDAVKYKDAFFADLTKKTKAGELANEQQKRDFRSSYDWNRMTAQDETLWNAIFAHLEK